MKTILLLLVSLGVCFFFFNKNQDEIRIRVISNSESTEDLNVKNEVVRYLNEKILNENKLNDYYFENNYKNIENKLNKQFGQIITVTYEYHTFKNKTYNGNALENDKYKTLIICIGEAKGTNWWGSIFDGALQYESTDEIVYEWYYKK